MVSFFILCMFIKAIGAQNTTICVWGIFASGSSPKINGEYLYSGIHNNYPYYTMAVDATCSDSGKLLLYYRDTKWRIADELDYYIIYEFCQSSNDPLTTETGGCQNKWRDADMQVTSGSCPEWDCDAITTSWPNTDNCGATFDIHVAPNVYMASSNGAYLYYNHHLGHFMCNDVPTTGCAPDSVWAVSQDPWTELLKGSSIDVEFLGQGVKTVYCIGYTTSPTTTNYPTTMLPTTAIPISSMPTTSPNTAMPTTLTPTTVIPTTNTPTTSIPTIIPTLVPTITNEPSTHIPTTDFPNTATPTTNEEQVSDEVSTTMSLDTRSHSQNNHKPFVIILICIVLIFILISCLISVYALIQKQKQNKNKATENKLNNIALAPQVNNVGNNDDIDIIFYVTPSDASGELDNSTVPVMMAVKSLSVTSDDSNVMTPVVNDNLSGICNDEGNGTDSDAEDLYQDQPNNDITTATPQGTTAGNE